MRKKLTIIGIIAAIFGIGGFFYNEIAFGNPAFIAETSNCRTASATTSPSYMTSGNATTTLVCDTYQTGNYVAGTGVNMMSLLLQFNASRTPVFNLAFEYANGSDGVNCKSTPNACDWYENYLDTGFSSTTPVFNLATADTFNFTYLFATSTPGGQSSVDNPLVAIGANSSRVDKIITVPSPTRYIRAVFTMTGSGNSNKGSIWAEFIPKKEYK